MRYANLPPSGSPLDPSHPIETIETFVQARTKELEQHEELDEVDRQIRKVVSVRLDASDIHLLDVLAKRLQYSRSGLATDLLEIAIEQARARLGIPRPGLLRYESDGSQVTLKDEDDRVLGQFEDDAMQIGGGDR